MASRYAARASRRTSPALLMLLAPTTSALAAYPHITRRKPAWVVRFSPDTCPHSGQVREVLRGSTAITSRPALSALLVRIARNTPQPASKMLLFSPAFAADPLGRNPPACSRSGFAAGLL